MSPRQRLFFALWPDAAVRDALARLAREALGRRHGRRIPAENLHLTLLFLGGVDAELRERLERGAGALAVPAFELSFEHLGHYARSRVLWSAPAAPPAPLCNLVQRLREIATGCGLEPEGRPYRPHVTLARKVQGAIESARHTPIPWEVGELALVESITAPEGARYRVARSWPLAAGSADPAGVR